MHLIWNTRTDHPLLTRNAVIGSGQDGRHENVQIGFGILFLCIVRPILTLTLTASTNLCNNGFGMSVKQVVTLRT